MTKKAILVLEDSMVFEGQTFGAETTTYGEVVFDTAMAGYQEMLTDPSFAGQIVTPTYPLIGNYGINDYDVESKRVQVRGFAVREHCLVPSHYTSRKTLHQYLLENGVSGIAGIDTRSLVRHIRYLGVMMGILTSELTLEEAKKELKSLPPYGKVDYVREVSTGSVYEWDGKAPGIGVNITVLDGGVKYNILRILRRLGCTVNVTPCNSLANEILKLNPDGIVLSPGPGDPALLDYMKDTARGLIGKKPVMGICLGHQILGHAFGASTFKLKFGHRGGNHPVRDLTTGRVHITTQNHGYAVDADTVKNGLEVSQINLNDGTVEGLRHRDLPVLSIQYHPEAAPGPQDNTYLFDRFVEMAKSQK
ncbi:MAG: glutamine-hydrolyzing carbamoyl-phosphate synthase small subunit [Chloroflexota bacterium]